MNRAASLVGSRAQAEDLVQEAWMRLNQAMEQRSVREPLACLYRIIPNLALDGRRAATRERQWEVDGAGTAAILAQHAPLGDRTRGRDLRLLRHQSPAPSGAAFAGCDRAALEVWVFYLAWLGTFAHGWARPAGAWAEQSLIIALLAGVAVLLNWLTTGDHLVGSLAHRHLWPVAGMDALLLLAGAAALCWALRRAGRSVPGSDVRRHQ